MKEMSFKAKTAVFTKGAGGIGSGICRVLAQAILKNPIQPEDIGAAILSLTTTFHQTTGCVIPVDGGK
jgi:hypothetical protein